MYKLKTSTICVVALVAAGCSFSGAVAQQSTETEVNKATVMTSSNQYVGVYYAKSFMTNSSGGLWIIPPTNALTGTFQDASGFPSPYSSSVLVQRRSDLAWWCTNNNNSVTFPATNSSYSLTVYVVSSCPPPTNGQPMTLQVTWNTNAP